MDIQSIKTGKQARDIIRKEAWTAPTPGMAPGYTQANLVILPKDIAFDFFLFCQRNPKPCPVLDVTEPGNYKTVMMTKDGDLRTDIPKYRIYRNGVLEKEVTNIKEYWNDDMVGFLLGCSFSFETALLEGGVPIRHIEENVNVPMYITNIECEPAGIFSGPTVVSMRPMKKELVEKAIKITAKLPQVHGSPIHVGNPEEIGIRDINKPDFGDSVTINEGEVPVFWACGVTPQAAIMKIKPEFVITHSPGHMFIGDILDKELMIKC